MISENYSGFLFGLLKFYIDHLDEAYQFYIHPFNVMCAHLLMDHTRCQL